MNTTTFGAHRLHTVSRWAIACGFALGLVWAGASYAADAITEDNVAEHITAAKTAADHEAIAAFYKSEAAGAAAKVKVHESMANAYSSPLSGKPKGMITAHCQDLVTSFRKAQKDYEELAKEHEAMAKSAGK